MFCCEHCNFLLATALHMVTKSPVGYNILYTYYQVNPRMVKGWGETHPQTLFLLPFPNRLELTDAPWRLFLNMN